MGYDSGQRVLAALKGGKDGSAGFSFLPSCYRSQR